MIGKSVAAIGVTLFVICHAKAAILRIGAHHLRQDTR